MKSEIQRGLIVALFFTAMGCAQTAPTVPTRFSVVVEGPAAGKAPDVILIPGLASSREVFGTEARLLAPRFRLHLVQIAGFAGEAAGPNATGSLFAPVVEQLHEYIAVNHLDHPAVIGHSLGGLLGLMLASAHPADVGKVLIVDALPFYGLIFGPSATVENMRPQAQALHDGLLAMNDEQFSAVVPQFAAALVSSKGGLKAFTASALASDRRVYANAMLEDMGTDLRPAIPAIKTPLTVVYPWRAAQGSKETVDALYKGAYAAAPNVHFVRIDDSMHFIMYDQPAAFHQAVLGFLGVAE